MTSLWACIVIVVVSLIIPGSVEMGQSSKGVPFVGNHRSRSNSGSPPEEREQTPASVMTVRNDIGIMSSNVDLKPLILFAVDFALREPVRCQGIMTLKTVSTQSMPPKVSNERFT